MSTNTTINIKKTTAKRLGEYCKKHNKVRTGELDIAVNKHLDEVEGKR